MGARKKSPQVTLYRAKPAGVTEAIKTLLLVLPTLIGAFLIAGYIRVLMPEDVVREWLGEGSVFPLQHRFTMRAGVFKPSQHT